MKVLVTLCALAIVVNCSFQLEDTQKVVDSKLNITSCLHEAGLLSEIFDQIDNDKKARKGFPVFVNNTVNWEKQFVRAMRTCQIDKWADYVEEQLPNDCISDLKNMSLSMDIIYQNSNLAPLALSKHILKLVLYISKSKNSCPFLRPEPEVPSSNSTIPAINNSTSTNSTVPKNVSQ